MHLTTPRLAGQAPAAALKIRRLYRVREVMDQLSISRATVYRLVAAGRLRLVKIGPRSSGITAESIDALISGAPRGQPTCTPGT